MALPQVSINTDINGLCFGCGQSNTIGLKLSFRRDGDSVFGEFICGEEYQGWPGIIHGGIIACILDEAMSHAAHSNGKSCITAKLEIRFKNPASVGETLLISSHLTRNTRKLIEAKAKISLKDGTVVAEGSALQYIVKDRLSCPGGADEESRSDA